MSSCSEIWPGIRGQPCASVWQVRKHLSGRGRSVAQCCFKLTALERQGNLSDREIASTHQFTVVEKTVVRGTWGHLDPRPQVLNEELVPGKWLLLAVENFGSTWGKCLPRCPHFIFPDPRGTNSQIRNPVSNLPERFRVSFRVPCERMVVSLSITCPLHLSGSPCTGCVDGS